MNKTTSLKIVKGVLLHLTILSIAIEILAIDNISSITFIAVWTLLNIYLSIHIHSAYTWEEIKYLTGNTYLAQRFPTLFDVEHE